MRKRYMLYWHRPQPSTKSIGRQEGTTWLCYKVCSFLTLFAFITSKFTTHSVCVQGWQLKKKEKTFVRSADESLLRGSLSLILSRGKTTEKMKGNPIIINKLLVPKDSMAKARNTTEMEAGGIHTPWSGG